jgi:hypothetical protein
MSGLEVVLLHEGLRLTTMIEVLKAPERRAMVMLELAGEGHRGVGAPCLAAEHVSIEHGNQCISRLTNDGLPVKINNTKLLSNDTDFEGSERLWAGNFRATVSPIGSSVPSLSLSFFGIPHQLWVHHLNLSMSMDTLDIFL